MGRIDSDEYYVLDLFDEVLGSPALRQHRFEWLRGDPSPKTGRTTMLPVDGFWPDLGLVVELYEAQHDEPVSFFDKPERLTVSGVHRGEQRRIYDERRRQLVPRHGLRLVIVRSTDFAMRGKKIARRRPEDLVVTRRILERPALQQ